MINSFLTQATFFLAFGLTLVSCSPNDENVEAYIGFDINKSAIDLYLTEKMSEFNIPGLSFALINDGDVVHHSVLGYSDKSTQEEVDKNSIFEGASISKSVFAFFVMTFVEEGLLDLDKPLFNYLPHPDIEGDNRYHEITARMVLSHRSGLPNWREDEEGKRLETKFKPGSDYLYSGEGFQYLAMVLMHVTKTDHAGLEELFQQKIASPLGLKNTSFVQTPYSRKHKAEPYDEEGEWIDWQNGYWFQKEDKKFYAPSSIHSESLDFSRWMIGVMSEEVLSTKSYDEILTRHSAVPFEGLDVSYCLGFLQPHIPFTDIYLHSGDNIGFTSWYALDVNDDWGFILFTNSANGSQLGQELFFYLLTGPNTLPLYLTLGLIIIILFTVVILGVRFLIRKIRN